MSEQNKLSMPYFYSIIMYICGLFLFLEWIYPVRDLTDTRSISIFVIFTVFCFFVSIINMQWWISFILKSFGLIFILNGLYFEMLFLSPAWFGQLYFEVYININYLLSQEWYYLTPFFRSFLFLLLIWLMSYLLHYWFVQMRRIFLFIVLTFIYIGVLDTFTLYDAAFPVIRTFVIALVALAMVNFSRDLQKEKIPFHWLHKAWTWVIPLSVTIVFSVIMGVVTPKLDPQWPDPVPFIQNAAEQATGSSVGGTVQKVGYGEDDSQLGGSFIQDDSPVFYAEAEESHYWRIETKDIYTGKGWEKSAQSHFQYQDPLDIQMGTFYGNVETSLLSTNISFESDQLINRFVYPYGVREIHADDIERVHADIYLDPVTNAMQGRLADGMPYEFAEYSLIYDYPSVSLTKLRQSSIEGTEMDEYLQLPDTLPSRVGELAEEITADKETLYEKVRAIERYFGSNGFSYDTTGIAVPGQDEDYVDQFLFETQRGYCDNFSTSMVVMLRTLDIPARWAKGFTSGEVITTGETHDTYEVTNANAHSWVEVFFPGTGWVSFEPTQGFSNPTDFHTESSNDEDYEEFEDVLEQEEPEFPEGDDLSEEEEEAETAMGQSSGNDDFPLNWWQMTIIAFVILALVYLLYKKRYQIKTFIIKQRVGKQLNERNFQDAYLHLLKVLDHYGYSRDADQTLRQFAKRIDFRYQTGEMEKLTHHYEQMLYRDAFDPRQQEDLKKLWENLLNKVMG